MRKSFLEYPWIRDRTKRRYMLGCLKAFLKSGVQRKFYDLGRVNYWGPQSAKNVDFQFDQSRQLSAEQIVAFQSVARGRKSLRGPEPVMACGGGPAAHDDDFDAPERSLVTEEAETAAVAAHGH